MPSSPKATLARRLRDARRALALVWSAAPFLTVLWMAQLVVSALLPVASVYLTRLLVDAVTAAAGQGLSAATVGPVVSVALALAVTILVTRVLQLFATWLRAAHAEKVQDRIRTLVHEAAYRADLALYESPDYHDQMERARTDASRRPLALLESTGGLVQSGLTLSGMAALVIPYGVWVPGILVISTIPAFYVAIRANRRMHTWWQDRTSDRRWVTYDDWLLTYADYAAELRLFDLGPRFIDSYRTLRRRLRGERLALLRRASLAGLAASLGALAVTASAMAWMLRNVFTGLYTLGDLVLFYQAFDRGQSLMRSLLGNLGQVYTNTLFLENLFEFLDLQPRVEDPDRPRDVPERVTQGISFENVTFRYPGTERFALRQFNLTLDPGKITAIVGPNGAGKSTVVKLLCRFYDPEQGCVALDGIPLPAFAVGDLRRRIGAVFQTPISFHATVAQNIAYGATQADIDMVEVERAARAAGVDEIVERLPMGYDTMLGKWFTRGTQLSVGEWQRIAIARAFIREAPILLLDEPTSSMDSWAESEWLAAFRAMVEDRVVLVVTHRFSVAFRADIVHVMKEGTIVESGTPKALLDRGGMFARSWEQQASSAR